MNEWKKKKPSSTKLYLDSHCSSSFIHFQMFLKLLPWASHCARCRVFRGIKVIPGPCSHGAHASTSKSCTGNQDILGTSDQRRPLWELPGMWTSFHCKTDRHWPLHNRTEIGREDRWTITRQWGKCDVLWGARRLIWGEVLEKQNEQWKITLHDETCWNNGSQATIIINFWPMSLALLSVDHLALVQNWQIRRNLTSFGSLGAVRRLRRSSSLG